MTIGQKYSEVSEPLFLNVEACPPEKVMKLLAE
jgi:hypothetical protein